MRSKAVAAAALFFLAGCFATAPETWNEQSRRDAIDRQEQVDNGSRLELAAKDGGDDLIIASRAVPLCRNVEVGHQVVHESGRQEMVSWPLGLLGLGAAVAGGYYGWTGLKASDDKSLSDDQKNEGMAKGMLGVVGGTLGAIAFIACGLNQCGDADTEYRDRSADPFRHWEKSSERKDCPGGRKKPVSVPFQVSALFATTDLRLEWNQETGASGRIEMPILHTIKAVAAHCGQAKVVVTSGAGEVRSNDSAEKPSAAMDYADAFQFTVDGRAPQNPALITDVNARRIASGCAEKKSASCLGSRAEGLRQKCSIECNSQAGAEYCEMKMKKIDLAISGLSDADKGVIFDSYKACVAEHGVTDGKTESCRNGCFAREAQQICPNGW